MIKKLFFFCFCLIPFFVFAQNKGKKTKENKGYEFTIVKEILTTSVKDQHRSGTCWSFAATSFVEAELLRQGMDAPDLSEMFAVRKCYEEKANKYVRMHGTSNFTSGGSTNDVLDVITKYGAITNEAYSGQQYGAEEHIHGELDKLLKAYISTLVTNPNKELSTAWRKGYNGILDAYLGVVPEKFQYQGKEYTTEEFAKKIVPINAKDYVYLTSFTHHPFYSEFILEYPDNWSNQKFFNIPIDEMVAVIDNALEKGYTICWAADVSEKGFSWKNGLAVVPETDIKELSGSEKLKWETLTKEELDKQIYSFDSAVTEKKITQILRQTEFDNYKTTDDHLMHITGIAKDQNGNKFYKVKNSWGNKNHKYNGYLFVSEAYFKLKTINILLHKDGLPEETIKKYNQK
jgi:bleomycin hydrolase